MNVFFHLVCLFPLLWVLCCEFPLLCTQFVVCLSLNNLLSPLSFSVNSCSLTFTKSLSTYGIVILPYFQYCPSFSVTFKSFILVHWFLHVICKKYPTLLTFCAHFVLSALLIEEAVFFYHVFWAPLSQTSDVRIEGLLLHSVSSCVCHCVCLMLMLCSSDYYSFIIYFKGKQHKAYSFMLVVWSCSK